LRRALSLKDQVEQTVDSTPEQDARRREYLRAVPAIGEMEQKIPSLRA
jgi:hypothetical protein